jgi:hypothetical protein
VNSWLLCYASAWRGGAAFAVSALLWKLNTDAVCVQPAKHDACSPGQYLYSYAQSSSFAQSVQACSCCCMHSAHREFNPCMARVCVLHKRGDLVS